MTAIAIASLLPEPPARRHDEDKLQASIVQYLRWALPADAMCLHIPNGGQRSKRAAARLNGLGVVAGIPDLLVVYRSKAYFLELKSGRGVLSTAQREIHRKLNFCDVPVMVCRSLPECESMLRECCIPLRASATA